MRHQRAPRWRRRPLLALCARSAAFLLPFVVSGVAAMLVLDAFTGWPAAWRVVWWTCAVVGATVAALVFVPVAQRLSALSVLLGLEVEFPSPAPSRVRLAVGTSTITSAQFELARAARADSSDELLTARLATASMLGVFRTMQVRNEDRVRVFSTVGLALFVAVAALLVVPDRAESPRSPLTSEPQAESPIGRRATVTVPTTPDSSNAGGSERGATGALPSVAGIGSAEAHVAPPAAPESAPNAPGDSTGTKGTRSVLTSSAGRQAAEAVTAATPGPPRDAGLAVAVDLVGHADVVPTKSVLDTGVQTTSIPPPAVVTPAVVTPAVVTPAVVTPAALVPAADISTPSEQAESDDVHGAPARGSRLEVDSEPSSPRGTDHATDAPRSDDEQPRTDAPSTVEHGAGAPHATFVQQGS